MKKNSLLSKSIGPLTDTISAVLEQDIQEEEHRYLLSRNNNLEDLMITSALFRGFSEKFGGFNPAKHTSCGPSDEKRRKLRAKRKKRRRK